MRRLVGVLVCGVALADGGARSWDAIYVHAGGTGVWPCPDASDGEITVANGQFSLPWQVAVGGDRVAVIGRIDGAVRADGTTTTTTSLASPLPRGFVDQARKARIRIPRDASFDVAFVKGSPRAIHLTGDVATGHCAADWHEDTSRSPPPPPSADLDCGAKPYAVAAWSDNKPYGGGAYTQLASHGDTRVYRCAKACAVGANPADDDGTWALVGRCAAAKQPADPYEPSKPDAPLPDHGDGKWDTSYEARGGQDGADWRCPRDVAGKVVVSHGKLSLPWRVFDDGRALDVGHLDVVIRADGTTQIAPVVTIDSLDMQFTQRARNRGFSDVSLASLARFAPTITFFDDKDVTKNEHGVGRRFDLAAVNGPSECSSPYAALDYKPQKFREEDGWRVPCSTTPVYDTSRDYATNETATVVDGNQVERMYVCEHQPRCAGGRRPDKNSEWTKVGRCKSDQ